MHIHLSVISAISSFLGVIIIGFFWRLAALKMRHNPLGQGMAFVY